MIGQRALTMLLLFCVPAGLDAQVISMQLESLEKRRLTRAYGAGHSGVEMFVWPAVVTMDGEKTVGAFTAIADPVHRWFWWHFRDTSRRSPAPSAIAEYDDSVFVVYPTSERLVVLRAEGRSLQIGFGTQYYPSDDALPNLVRGAFDLRAGVLGRGWPEVLDFYEKELDIVTPIGQDFFVDPRSSAPMLAPVKVESVIRSEAGWEIGVSGRIPDLVAVIRLSSDFEIQSVARVRMK